ncbi:hypothetical protein Pan241w_40540 [Gimesia alba]|uniref:Uncharacterized protein n=1 Tax=Gimesia alba TaxID=2527973 RepID=A0A517RJ96_9PLAN|nr:hypothetical protein [Gimesia alba]QDT43950.1 hypothetical protein Pan241w_40540 [Gimesia alba]
MDQGILVYDPEVEVGREAEADQEQNQATNPVEVTRAYLPAVETVRAVEIDLVAEIDPVAENQDSSQAIVRAVVPEIDQGTVIVLEMAIDQETAIAPEMEIAPAAENPD